MSDANLGLALFLGLTTGGAVGAIVVRAIAPRANHLPVFAGLLAGAILGLLCAAAITGTLVRL